MAVAVVTLADAAGVLLLVPLIRLLLPFDAVAAAVVVAFQMQL